MIPTEAHLDHKEDRLTDLIPKPDLHKVWEAVDREEDLVHLVIGEDGRAAEVDEDEDSTPDETTPGRGVGIAHETETETIGKETVAQVHVMAPLGECGNQSPVGVVRTEAGVHPGERGAFRPRGMVNVLPPEVAREPQADLSSCAYTVCTKARITLLSLRSS